MRALVRIMDSTRSSLGHNPFKDLKSRFKEKPPEKREEPAKPVVQPAAHDPKADRQFFLQAMEGTRPLTGSNREEGKGKPAPAGPAPKSGGEEALEAMKALIAFGRGFVVADTPEYIEGTGYQVSPKMAERLHRGEFSIQAHIDLHGLGAEEARSAFEDFLRESVIRNRRSLLVIHGRGLSSQGEPILKASLTEWLTRGPWRKWVIAYSSARLCDGGAGATCILLRTRPVTKRHKKDPIQGVDMKKFARTLTLAFSAGALGGLANGLCVWLAVKYGLTAALGVSLAAPLTPAWIYPRIVWGGIWGLLFIVPLWERNPFLRGLFFSIGPTLVMLFVIFPLRLGKGMMGLDLGTWTPAFVILFNAVWGWTAALWMRWVNR